MADKLRIFFVLMVLGLIGFNTISCAQSEAAKLQESGKYEISARELRLKKDFRGALREQLKAVELNPNDSKPLTILAGIYEEISETENAPENLQKAKETLEKAVKLDPKDAVAHSMLADALALAGDKQKAVDEMSEAVRLDARNAVYASNLGTYYGAIGNRQAERAQYEKAISLDSNYSTPLYNLALLEEEDGNFDRAIRLFNQYAELNPQDAESINQAKEKIKKLEILKSQKQIR